MFGTGNRSLARRAALPLVVVGSLASSMVVSQCDPAPQTCHKNWTKSEFSVATGNVLGTAKTWGEWCVQNGVVVSATFVDSVAETSTPGWRVDNRLAKAAGVVDGQGRIYSKYEFVLGIGGWDAQHKVLCPRVRGTAAGNNLADSACTLQS